jgi:hypothetical protein
MKFTLEIRSKLKQRIYLKTLVSELEQYIKEAIKNKERSEKKIKELNFELQQWDEFNKKV